MKREKIEICINKQEEVLLELLFYIEAIYKKCREHNITKYICKDGFNLSVKKQFCNKIKEKLVSRVS